MDQNELELRLELKNADILAMTIDIVVERGMLNSRSLIADSRLNYGDPHKYKHLTEEEISKHKERLYGRNP